MLVPAVRFPCETEAEDGVCIEHDRDCGGELLARDRLREREGERLIPVVSIREVVIEKPPLNRRERDFTVGGKIGEAGMFGGTEMRGERCDGWVAEDQLRRKCDAGRAGFGNDEDAEDAVAAEFEEIVVNADALDFQNALPDVGELLLGRIARRDEVRGDVGAFVRGFRKCALIEFAIAGEWHFPDCDERGRNHVVGERAGEVCAEFRRGGCAIRRNEPCKQAFAAFIVACEDGGFADVRMIEEDALDLTQLDAEAANFHLLVYASEILDVAAGQSPREIAGAVESRTCGVVEWVRDESLFCQLVSAEVAARETFAGDKHFTGNADWHGSQAGVEDVKTEIGNGHADDAAALHVVRTERAVGDVDGGLGDAVHVHELRPCVVVACEPRREAAHFQRFAAEDDQTQREFRRAR